MTTKPKAKKFRIRRTSSSAAAAAAARPVEAPGPDSSAKAAGATTQASASEVKSTQATASAGQKDAKPSAPTGQAMSGQVSSARETKTSTDIDEIRREGLTGRQLRMARRVAQQHNLPVTSDFEAVRLLRLKGIDPFKRSNMLELVVPQNKARPEGAPDPGAIQLPQTVPAAKTTLPSTELSPAERRNKEIQEIQRDIAKRRRRKLWLLLGRLSFFVMLPTLITGYYFYAVATPMYSAKSEFLVLKADSAGSMSGLLSGTQFATSQDSTAVQSFLQSKEAMLRLDEEVGFKAHFTQDWIDPIQRLDPAASNEQAYKIYSRNVKIGYDPTEGVIRMEVTAADPVVSAEFSDRLISYAQEKVNHLSEQKRSDQVGEAEAALELAETKRRQAQEHLVRLQQKGAVLDPEGVILSLRSQISTFEVQLQEKELELAALMDNTRPNQAKVAGAEADISRLEALIQRLNDRMTDAAAGENSLASLSVQIQMAQADLATRDLMLQSALQQVETTRMEANRQVRYLTTAVEPVPSEEPSYPRKFENTILAFLIFSGIYLMCSLTASILREQVSS
ncbi:capsule biosynthesis protein [Phaeobacter gallaeciensis]|uniref:capsule biosynthesis protein n=1 Tax=Phaeobacter gallaeciensis TaxID=60890 RepID=UPI00237FAB61|nr:capsule biosynthesis protein [Phaeobacter gallaeciensis]MDE4191699.1 capsule biosynthesis protein [Phaeobacter gallaeciensis]MDE4200162.1 capsule biosynthesis protein [Phaeobacter gallaeciensis]MDE4204390.1 capsule biosynthesis protein [Phaeobacter gallaeciensis]MDE4208454.1 capsule biosynthesis protein [Phaeobacter gallaeciensis]MDE4216899.1 capsule biosynthesis protein [Phaeobacter gallaeciensis]